ncbi:High affinity copper uptake protein 1 [Lamellibrachia satsuma]|nr:High affinity copper uptake protein 1 [Lamellibrachia satsuma]
MFRDFSIVLRKARLFRGGKNPPSIDKLTACSLKHRWRPMLSGPMECHSRWVGRWSATPAGWTDGVPLPLGGPMECHSRWVGRWNAAPAGWADGVPSLLGGPTECHSRWWADGVSYMMDEPMECHARWIGSRNMIGMNDTNDMDGMGGMDGVDGMHMMNMYFHFGAKSTILFSFWKTTNWQGMVGSCLGVFFLAMFYGALKVGREILLKRSSVRSSKKSVMCMMFRPSHLLQSLLHVVQTVISYFLMLIFMTFNLWLCMAVSVGAGIGYFLFAWSRTAVEDPNEHCH